MKRLLNILAFIAVLSVSFSCTQEEANPTAEFKDKILALHATQSVDVTVILDKPAAAAVSVPVEFTCNSDAYQASADKFDFAAGESSATLTVTDINLPAGESITLKLLPANGVQIGTNYTCVITKDAAETLIYNFSRSKASLVSGGTATVSLTLTGQYSGDNFKAAEDMAIPVVIAGDGKNLVGMEEGVTGFTVKAGTNTASLKLVSATEFETASTATLTLGSYEGATLTAGETGSMAIELSTYLNAAELAGTWNFSHVYDVEELEIWFVEMEDDPELLPLDNEGFTLTFAVDKNGSVTLTPGVTGDFANFFRTATITPTAPMNLVADGVVTGDYTATESNMFQVEATGELEFNNTFFKLSNANRAFSADSETLGESVISLRLTIDGDLELTFRDYDTPPFGEMWWDGSSFDPEMFGFCSVFTKAE